MKTLKPVFVRAVTIIRAPVSAQLFMSTSWIIEVFLTVWAWVRGATDWSLFGAALAGSTVFVVYEAIEGKVKRKGWERFGIVALGVTVAIFLTSLVSKRYEIEAGLSAFAIGALTYKGLGKLFKDDKPISETIDEFKPPIP